MFPSAARFNLLYRATRDGFSYSQFLNNCGNLNNLVIAVKTDTNYIFGGYASVKWDTNIFDYDLPGCIADTNAFIFSLRRKGISNNEKFDIRDTENAICYPGASIAFGKPFSDIWIDPSMVVGHSGFGQSYKLPANLTIYSNDADSFLAGSYSDWKVVELEAFQVV